MTRQIYTIGYAGRDPQRVKEMADKLGAYLFDIRFSPRSRDPRWAKSNLQKVFGQKYIHLPEWGNANYKNGGDVQIVNFEQGRAVIDRLASPVMIMCACKDPTWCHRTFLADMLIDLNYSVTELA